MREEGPRIEIEQVSTGPTKIEDVTVPGAGISVDSVLVNVAVPPPQEPARAGFARIVALARTKADHRIRELLIKPP